MNWGETVVAGVLKPDGTLELSEKPKLAPGPVTVVLRQDLPAAAPRPLSNAFLGEMQTIWSGQRARGHTSGSAAAARQELRDQMDREIEAATQLQETARRDQASADPSAGRV